MVKKYFLIFMVLFLIINVSSLDVKRDTSEDLSHPIRIDDFPSSSIFCNISLFDPDGIELIDFQPMTNQFEKHNYTVDATNNSKLGTYKYDITCTTGLSNKTESFDYEVTETGHTQETSQAIGSLGFLIMMIALTFFLGYIGFRLSETENLWVLGIFFLFLMVLFLVFDIYLGYEYRLNYTGADNDSTVIEILFYSFLFLFTTGVGITIVMLFRKWHKIVDWFKAALKNDAEPDDDYFSGQDNFRG